MKYSSVTAALLLISFSISIFAGSYGNSFSDIRYNGGTLQTRVSPKDWDNHLTVTSDQIKLDLKDGQTLIIDPKKVTGLSYGQEAHRRVGTMIALGILVAPVALFGLFHKTRLHFVGIEYETPDGKSEGVLLQAHKNNYKAVLTALHGATGAKIAVAEDDRKYVPVGVDAQAENTTNEKTQPKSKPKSAASPAARVDQLKIGMDVTQVKAIMGEPKSITKTTTEEGVSTTWIYNLDDGTTMQMLFKNSVVKSIQQTSEQK